MKRALPKSDGIICGEPCPHGGLSSARKYSRVDLGAHAVCNRRVTTQGAKCWQHEAKEAQS